MCEQNRMQIFVYNPIGQPIEVFLDSQDPVHIGQTINLEIHLKEPVKEFYGYTHTEIVNGDIHMVELQFKITDVTVNTVTKLYNAKWAGTTLRGGAEFEKIPNRTSNCISASINRSDTVYAADLINLRIAW